MSTRPLECGTCGTDHPSDQPCPPKVVPICWLPAGEGILSLCEVVRDLLRSEREFPKCFASPCTWHRPDVTCEACLRANDLCEERGVQTRTYWIGHARTMKRWRRFPITWRWKQVVDYAEVRQWTKGWVAKRQVLFDRRSMAIRLREAA